MKQTITTHSAGETAALGQRLGQALTSPTIIAFKGGMGSGKTCFTAGLCKGLGYTGDVTSPTFALVNEYLGGRLPVYHFDVYRIEDDDELYGIGFYDYLEQPAVLVIEWSENIENALPREAITVSFVLENETTREITINGEEALLKELTESYAHPGT